MNWDTINEEEKQKAYFKDLKQFVLDSYKRSTCYPPYEKIFAAIQNTSFEATKCVILGQDPYHGAGQAMGLSFSVNKNVAIPPSLQNIFKELHNELGTKIPNNGDLTPWTKQGVLLLNAILSVQANQPASHRGHGWEIYTDALLAALNKKETPVVFMLWGNYAKAKQSFITNKKHLVLTSPHPSPYSASYGFFGNGHFKKCNDFLIKTGQTPIDWQIPNI